MLATSLEERNQILYDKLVPGSGPAETLEGEALRAINKIIYRFYNDGDYWYEGYGTETAGPAEAFLRELCPVDIRPELNASESDDEYEKQLGIALEKIVDYIEGRESYTPTKLDMLDWKPRREWNQDS